MERYFADVLVYFQYRTPWTFTGPRSKHLNGYNFVFPALNKVLTPKFARILYCIKLAFLLTVHVFGFCFRTLTVILVSDFCCYVFTGAMSNCMSRSQANLSLGEVWRKQSGRFMMRSGRAVFNLLG